jgi:hypothetical protein
MNAVSWYALGLGSAVLLRPVAKASRPLLRTAIRSGLVVSREVQRATEEARASLADLTAEARADLDGQEQPPASAPQP